MRYFITNEDGQQQFRLGGFLKNKANAHKYIMLSNGKSAWSVQVEGAVFFRQMSHDDQINQIHQMYEEKLQEKDATIKKLKDHIRAHLIPTAEAKNAR